ncbi:MAG: Trp biosynthesis-associated membrane protein [bacterium]|nr:Trp biosynthesis-associated membrane protein [bacterium]
MRRALPALLAGSGILVLASSAGAWFSGTTTSVTGEVPLTVTGGSVPVAGAAGLVLLAAAAALLLARRSLTRVVGAIAALLAAGAGIAVVVALRDPSPLLADAAATATGLGWSGGEVERHVAAWLALVGLAVGAGGGIAVAALGGRADEEASRFERAPANEDTRVRAMDDWDAIGRGEDPSENGGRLGD